MAEQFERKINTETIEQTANIFGSFDANAALIERAFGVSVRNRESETGAGDTIVITGPDERGVADAASVVGYLKKMSRFNDNLTEQSVDYVIEMVRGGHADELGGFDEDCICITTKGKPIKAKTVGQRRYVEEIKKNTIVLGVGPAGTGKTFLAVAMAVTALRNKEIERIILTRPAVEAGEKLGFLPGDLQTKVDPYLRPLYDALSEMFGLENYQKLMEKGVIEVAPLAYMRGRTLANAFIILDEAQNTTIEQMKMFLTRMGDNSRIAVNGDLTQIDLPKGTVSGLRHAARILEGINDIAIVRFGLRDIVRNSLVAEILRAYEGKDLPDGETNAKKDNDDE